MTHKVNSTLIWSVLMIGLVWSVYSTTADLVTQVNCLKRSLFICGNTWLIRSVM